MTFQEVSNILKVAQLVGSMAESKAQDKSLNSRDEPALSSVSSCPSEGQVLA